MLVVEQEWRVLRRSRLFFFLMMFCMLQPVIRLIQIIANSIIIQTPNSVLVPILQKAGFGMLNERMLVEFVAIQTGGSFLLLLFAGAGTICNEQRNHLYDVYFSKPIRWMDYFAGKTIAHVGLGFIAVGLPGMFLIASHAMLLPGFTAASTVAAWMLAMLVQSLCLVAPMALSILAASAWIKSQGFAAVTVIAITTAATTMGGTLAALTGEENFLAMAFPMTLNRLAEHFFGDRTQFFNLAWYWCMSYVVVATLIFGGLFAWRVRRLERSN